MIDGLRVGGAERSLLMLCKHFQRFKPIVLVLSNHLAMLPKFEQSGIQVMIQPFPRDYRFRKHANELKPIVDSINPAIIHSSLFHSDMVLRFLDTEAKKVTGLVSTMYSDRKLKHLPWLTRQKIQFLKLWDQWTASRIDLYIANSNTIRNIYLEKVAYPSEKVKVIFRGRNLPCLKSVNSRKKNQFLYVGRLIPSKGIKEALQAFGVLIKNHPNLIFKIAGLGPELGNLKELVQKLNLEGKVVFLGQIDHVSELLAESSFFIFPTHYEGLPGALIEAMLAKIPIICSDIPENKECVDDSMAIFHRVLDHTDLFNQMEKALTLKDWEVRTQRAYDFAVKYFDIEKIASQYEEVYCRLLNH